MNLTSKKFISSFLIFSLMMLSANLYSKERRGAKLIVTKKDLGLIEGELIAVKQNSLLLLDTEGKDVSIDIADIMVIRIVKKSKVLKGITTGLLIGAGSGALLFAFDRDSYIGYSSPDAGMRALMGGIGGGFLGILIGGIVGLASREHKIIQIEERYPLTIEFILKKLRKKARIRDYK